MSETTLNLNTAFDQRDTLFTKAAERLVDIIANPPTGPRSFDLLNGSIRELSSLMIRRLPLTTTREARLAQALCLGQIVEDTTALTLGEGVATFLDRLQAAAERAGLAPTAPLRPTPDHELLRLERALQAMVTAPPSTEAADDEFRQVLDTLAVTPAQTLDGALAKLRAFRSLWERDAAGHAAEVPARLLGDAVETLERLVLATAVAEFDAAVEAFESSMPKALPTKPTDKMLAAGAKAGSVAMDAVRRIYQAMASEFLSPSKGVEK